MTHNTDDVVVWLEEQRAWFLAEAAIVGPEAAFDWLITKAHVDNTATD